MFLAHFISPYWTVEWCSLQFKIITVGVVRTHLYACVLPLSSIFKCLDYMYFPKMDVSMWKHILLQSNATINSQEKDFLQHFGGLSFCSLNETILLQTLLISYSKIWIFSNNLLLLLWLSVEILFLSSFYLWWSGYIQWQRMVCLNIVSYLLHNSGFIVCSF